MRAALPYRLPTPIAPVRLPAPVPARRTPGAFWAHVTDDRRYVRAKALALILLVVLGMALERVL